MKQSLLGCVKNKAFWSGRKSAPFLCFQKSNVLVSGGSADVADPCQFADIQLLALVGRVVAKEGGELTCGCPIYRPLALAFSMPDRTLALIIASSN